MATYRYYALLYDIKIFLLIVCPKGYYGEGCAKKCKCNDRGSCGAKGECFCDDGYVDDNCEHGEFF